jgi:hypothetical protein
MAIIATEVNIEKLETKDAKEDFLPLVLSGNDLDKHSS